MVKILRLSLIIFLFLILLLSLWLWLAFAKLPALRGSYPTGTVVYHWVDDSREEILTNELGDKREIVVQLWYPTEKVKNATTAPYFFGVNILAFLKTRSTLATPVSKNQEKYPLLIFSHGFGGLRTQSTFLFEELASFGYIVASIDHPFDAVVTIFPDGQVKFSRTQYFLKQTLEYEKTGEKLLALRKGDILFTRDKIEDINKENLFQGKIDTANLGLFGHSMGGATVAHLCQENPQFLACLNYDGALLKMTSEKQFFQPMMMMVAVISSGSEEEERLFYQWIDRFISNIQEGYLLTFKNAGHNDFTDLALFKEPFLKFAFGKDVGPIKGKKFYYLFTDYTLAFFDKYLKGKPSPLLEVGTLVSPEVDMVNISSK